MNRAALGTVVLAVSLSAGGCTSSAPQKSGLDIKNPADALAQGENSVRKLYKPALDTKQTTTSPDFRCYYMRTQAGSRDIADEMSCGPMRTLGGAPGANWVAVPMTFKQVEKSVVPTVMEMKLAEVAPADTGLMMRPDGKKPADLSTVPEPLAPEAPMSNVAGVVDPGQVAQVEFKQIEKPIRLVTPAGQLKVTASSELKLIPGAVVNALGQNGGGFPEYRPKAGQKVSAFRVQVAPVEGMGNPVSTQEQFSATARSVFGVNVGGRKLPLTDARASRSSSSASSSSWATTSSNSDSNAFVVTCASKSGSYYGGVTYPCAPAPAQEGVVVVVHDATQQPQLTASVNGLEQTLDLGSGEVSTASTRVLYERNNFTMSSGGALDPGTISVPSTYSPITCQSSAITVSQVDLSGFDPYQNWAKPGRAWLTVHLASTPLNNCYSFKLDQPNSVVINVGGKDQGSVSSHDSGRWIVFDVPSDFTEGKLAWRPKGRVSSYLNELAFEAPNRASLDISIPR